MMDIEIGAEMEKEKKREGAVKLKPCPFCGRNVRYEEDQGVFDWIVLIEHEYNTRVLYVPCPMRFYKHIPWRDRVSGEVFNEGFVKRMKQQFIETWNRGASE